MLNSIKKTTSKYTGLLIRIDDIAENMNWKLMDKSEKLLVIIGKISSKFQRCFHKQHLQPKFFLCPAGYFFTKNLGVMTYVNRQAIMH